MSQFNWTYNTYMSHEQRILSTAYSCLFYYWLLVIGDANYSNLSLTYSFNGNDSLTYTMRPDDTTVRCFN